jgi:hypothetical protein
MPPLIRVEIENMRHSMVMAFSDYQLKMDEMFKTAVEEACEPTRIQMVLNEAAKRYLNEAIDKEVKAFFDYGSTGRKMVKELVEKKLREEREIF